MIPAIKQRAMLVYVQISIWSARKLDRKQTKKTNDGAGATADAARVNKHLLANADDLLKEVQRKANEVRTYIEKNTLPWDDAGNRLISNDQALTMVGEVERLNREFRDAVDAFVVEYPVLRAQALQNLGEMADANDYPEPHVVRGKFNLKLSFTPIPDGFDDIRVGMTEAQAKAWQAHFENNVKTQVHGALRSAWERLVENLERYSDRLRLKDDGSGKMEIFRDTMVTSLRETTSLLASLNVFDDPELERITTRVARDIAAYEPDQLRNSQATAITVKNEVDDVLANIRNLLGE